MLHTSDMSAIILHNYHILENLRLRGSLFVGRIATNIIYTDSQLLHTSDMSAIILHNYHIAIIIHRKQVGGLYGLTHH